MQFRVKVHSDEVGVTEVSVEAFSADDALLMARQLGHLAFSALPVQASESDPWNRLKTSESRRFSLLQFSQQLLALLDAGLTIVEAIEALAEKEAVSDAKAILLLLIDQLRSGQSCSAAMDQLPEAFPPFYVATIRASERSGDLAESLRRFVAYQMQAEAVRKSVTTAMVYPAVLLVAGLLVTMFLLGYVVPKFSAVYQDRSHDLPWMSRVLMEWGHVVARHGKELLVAALGALALLAWGVMQPRMRTFVNRLLWVLPGFGERLRLYQLARLYRTLGMLLRGGTPVVSALHLVGGLLDPALRRKLEDATNLIEQGQTISEGFLASGLTSPVGHRMLRVGERSGRMGETMERVAGFYDAEIAHAIGVFTKVFEPVLMIVIGMLIGGIVILMYLPIFELAGSIQ